MKQAAMYVRVSAQQQKEGATIENQKSFLFQHAKVRGFKIHPEWIFEDNEVSGAKLARPALDKLDLWHLYKLKTHKQLNTSHFFMRCIFKRLGTVYNQTSLMRWIKMLTVSFCHYRKCFMRCIFKRLETVYNQISLMEWIKMLTVSFCHYRKCFMRYILQNLKQYTSKKIQFHIYYFSMVRK